MKQRQLLSIIPALGVVAIVSLVATSAQADESAKWKNGAQVYQKTCSYCHDTGIGPVIKGRELPIDYVKQVVRNGLQAMPAFRVSEFDDMLLADLANIINSSRAVQK